MLTGGLQLSSDRRILGQAKPSTRKCLENISDLVSSYARSLQCSQPDTPGSPSHCQTDLPGVGEWGSEFRDEERT
jgi:hypothetical protein